MFMSQIRRIILVFIIAAMSSFSSVCAQTPNSLQRFDADYQWLRSMIHPKTKLTLSSEDPLNPFNSYTYSNALTLILLVLRGTPADIDLAREIVQSMRRLQDEEGAWADAYHIQTGQIAAWNRASGPNGWMVIALLHYYKKTKDPLAWEMAVKTTDWLLKYQDVNPDHVTYGAIKLGEAFPYSEVRNTEANANCLAVFYAMAKFTDKPYEKIRYRQAARMVARFLTEKIWQGDYFAVAMTDDKGELSTFPELLDSQTWTLLSLKATEKLHGISPVKYEKSLSWILKHTTRVHKAEGFSKVTFSHNPQLDTDGDGDVDNSIWVEGTCGAILAFRMLGDHNHADYFFEQLEKLKLPAGRLPHILGPVQLEWPYHLPYASVDALWVIFSHPEINFNPYVIAD